MAEPYLDLHLHFERESPEGALAVRLEGTDRVEAPRAPLELEDLLRRAALLDRCILRAFRGGKDTAQVAAALGRARIRVLGRRLGDALGEVGEALAAYADVAYARLWVHVGEAGELDALPWEALEVTGYRGGFARVLPVAGLRGWQVLRARAAREASPGALEEVVVLVGDVSQPDGAPTAVPHAVQTVEGLRGLLGKRIPCAIAVGRSTYDAAPKKWKQLGVKEERDCLAAVEQAAAWLKTHPKAGLFVWIGHALDEDAQPGKPLARVARPGRSILQQGANALVLDPGVHLRVTAKDGRKTLPEMLPARTRLALLLGCRAQEGMAQALLARAEHVLGMRALIPPELAVQAAETVVAAFVRPGSAPVGEAVRRLRADLGTGARTSGLLRQLWWAPAHWTAVRSDEPFLDARAQLLGTYRRGLLAHLEGLEGDLRRHRRRLAEVVVPLRVLELDLEREKREKSGRGKRPSKEEEWQHEARSGGWRLKDLVLDEDGRVRPQAWVVCGRPGSGKTTCVRELARELAAGALGVTPVYVSLARWAEADLPATFEGLLQHVRTEVELPPHATKRGRDPLVEAMLDEAPDGRLVLLLDGLDEVPKKRRDAVETLLRNLATAAPKATILVTTRPNDYEPFDPARYKEAELLPLGETEMVELLTRWYEGELPAREAARRAEGDLAAILARGHSMRELAQVPLFLNLMGRKLLESGTLEASLRHKFLEEMTIWLLEGRHKPQKQRRALETRDGSLIPGRKILCELALALTQRSTTGLLRREVIALLEADARVTAGWGGADLFLDNAKATGLFRPASALHEDGLWSFWHRAFQEALTAEALLERHEKGASFAALTALADGASEEETGDSAEEGPLAFWREPFALLAGYLGKDGSAWVDHLLGHPELRSVGLAAVATADSLAPEVIDRALEQCAGVAELQLVYEHLGARLGQGPRAVAVLRSRGLALAAAMKRDSERTIRIELHFLVECLAALAQDEEAQSAKEARAAMEAVLATIGAPAGLVGAFTRIPGMRDELWAPVRKGTFTMGSPETEEGRNENEKQVEVTLGSDFWIARVPVTLGQYRLFDPRKEHRWGDDELLPVTEVTWYEAALFCRWLEHHGAALKRELGAAGAGSCFRLPTEAEWEYCCRDAGTRTTRFVSGDSEADLARVGVFGKGWQDGPERVASKAASADLHLHDMHGNVWEWCGDWVAERLRGGRDPAGPPAGAGRVLRGGSCWSDAWLCRSAFRLGGGPGWVGGFDSGGFRVVLAPSRPLLGDR